VFKFGFGLNLSLRVIVVFGAGGGHGVRTDVRVAPSVGNFGGWDDEPG